MTATTESGHVDGTTSGPVLVHDAAALTAARRAALARAGGESGTVAVVPTMGALHEGHVDDRPRRPRAGRRRDRHDLRQPAPVRSDRGPRPLPASPRRRRRGLLAEAGVDIVFAPAAAEMYPEGRPIVTLARGRDRVHVLEGGVPARHFDGVLTVVAKLLHLTAPAPRVLRREGRPAARRGATDGPPTSTCRSRSSPCPTVREDDGLALSSRNRYLSAEERTTALALARALRVGGRARRRGRRRRHGGGTRRTRRGGGRAPAARRRLRRPGRSQEFHRRHARLRGHGRARRRRARRRYPPHRQRVGAAEPRAVTGSPRRHGRCHAGERSCSARC